MRDFRSVLNVIGLLLCIEALAMLIPMLVDLLYKNADWDKFFLSSLITFFIGIVLYFSFKKEKNLIKVRQAFVLTILSWIIIAVFASLPFVFTSSNLNYTDAFFESISGITTTGSTVINNLETLHEGILIWRSLLQWFGGIGIIVLAIAILPTLSAKSRFQPSGGSGSPSKSRSSAYGSTSNSYFIPSSPLSERKITP